MQNFSTLVDLLRTRALNQPDDTAYIFLQDGENESGRLTYQELDRQARAFAAALQYLDASGERALLLYPPGLEFIIAFFGCLYAGVIAVPAYPPRRNQNLSRLLSIVTSSQAKVALTTASELANIRSRLEQNPELARLNWLSIDDLNNDQASSWQEPALYKNTLAFLQYTSGSTGTPKGVMVSHGNLLHNEQLIKMGFGHTADTLFVGWLPLFHDMGLVGNVLQPLYLGIPSILMPPVAFLQKPWRWLQAISHYKATTSGGPNFAYDLCVRKITPQQRSSLDLSSWSVAFNGAEPVRAETMERFADYFAPCGFRPQAFYPCYGMAETTLFVSGGLKTVPPVLYQVEGAALEQNQVVAAAEDHVNSQTIVGCGQTFFDKLVIVDPASNTQCRADQVGEIWVSGLSVAQGYWNRTEATEQTFNAYLADTHEGPFLRTGDLGFMTHGELFITGRLKDLIIIRGRNHYPQDIELTVEKSHPALRSGCGVAFSVKVKDEERLVVAQEVERGYLRRLNVDEVVGAIRRAVSEEHELHIYAVLLLRTASIPKTSSGKLQRHACRAGFLDGGLNVVGSSILEDTCSLGRKNSLTRNALLAVKPEDQLQRLESYLQALVAKVLAVEPSQVNPQQPLSTLGLDSLMAIELRDDIETSLGVVSPMSILLQGPNITQLAKDVLNQLNECVPTPDITSAPVQKMGTAHPLSYGQRSLWFLHQLAPESPAYNIVGAARIHSELEVPALQRALQTLVNRHPALRTTFTDVQGEPVAQIHKHRSVCFQQENTSAWSEAVLNDRLVEESHHSFDLEQGPLLRVSLFTQSDQAHILLFVVHHIVADFWSLTVLVKELGVLYQMEKTGSDTSLPPLALQYTDYAHWQSERLASSDGERLWAYWRKQLAGTLPLLNLPTDRPRPPVQTYRGASVPFKLSAELTQTLKALSRTHGATLYMVLLAAFQVLLYRYTGQDDLLVGSPTAGRSRAELAGLVGYFVNPVILRANLSGNPTFETFLSRVRSSVLEAFDHQDYPFALLVERLQPVRDPSRSPLVQTMFVLQKAHLLHEAGLTPFALGESGARMTLGELTLDSLALDQRVAQFDLTLMMAEMEGGLAASFVYNTDLFDATTIAQMARHFQTLLDAIGVSPQQPVSELPLLTSAEQHTLLVSWNDTQVAYPQDKCIHQLFEAQVERTPDAIALVYGDQQLTYQTLNCRANQLAHHLQTLGVGPETLVGICVERSLEMVVGLLGILKAGGAYVPLDPAYPPERLAFMRSDSQVPVLLTQQTLLSRLSAGEASVEGQQGTHIICLDTDWEAIAHHLETNPINRIKPDNLAYVIYTSGSTGKPKGVLVPHKGLLNLVFWHQRTFGVTSADRATQLAGTAFDASVWELWPYLATGARLYLIESELIRSPEYLRDWLVSKDITISFLPTPLAERLLALEWPERPALRIMLTGGDKLHQYPSASTPFTVINNYGPTENTVVTTSGIVSNGAVEDASPAIGRPIANTQVYILDHHLQPVPVGVPGELYIGGDGLARGYLNRPTLTKEKFIANPFNTSTFNIQHLNDARLYKTGDLARYLPDGTIEFLGRIDHQVNIRGFRIELGEIEAVLGQHPDVRKAVVIASEDQPSQKRLVAYVVTHTPSSIQTSNVSIQNPKSKIQNQLRRFLKDRLPDYMAPSAFVLLDSLPLTQMAKWTVGHFLHLTTLGLG